MLAGGQADGWNSDGGIDTETETLAATLSLWTDIEAVLEFAYGGLYRRAIDQERKWFCTPSYPAYVMWWSRTAQCQRGAKRVSVWSIFTIMDRRRLRSISRVRSIVK